MVVYIDKSGQPAQYFTSGWHDREAKIPAKPQALFKLASIIISITRLSHGD